MDKQDDKWECLVSSKTGKVPKENWRTTCEFPNRHWMSGSSINILPVKFVRNFKETETMLKTWKNEDYKPLRETRVVIRNPKNKKNYNVNFIICHNDFTQF